MCMCPVLSDSLGHHGLQPPRFFCPWNSPGKNTEVSCHFLLQEIFLSQGSNPHLLHLLHWQADSLPLEPLGKPHKYICYIFKYLPIFITYMWIYKLHVFKIFFYYLIYISRYSSFNLRTSATLVFFFFPFLIKPCVL